jgi:hypothetical protein
MEKFIQKSKIIAGLGLDSNFSEFLRITQRMKRLEVLKKSGCFGEICSLDL